MLKKGEKVKVVNIEPLKDMRGKIYICSCNSFAFKGNQLVYLQGQRTPISTSYLIKQ
jgi:hypothetical protein